MSRLHKRDVSPWSMNCKVSGRKSLIVVWRLPDDVSSDLHIVVLMNSTLSTILLVCLQETSAQDLTSVQLNQETSSQPSWARWAGEIPDLVSSWQYSSKNLRCASYFTKMTSFDSYNTSSEIRYKNLTVWLRSLRLWTVIQ